MNPNESAIGMALMCDEEGHVRKVLQNDFEINDGDLLGKHLPTIFGKSSLIKALSFVVDLKMNGRYFDCELDLPVGEKVILVHCAGLSFDNGFLIIAAETRFAIQHLFEGMMQINNEQSNLLRVKAKQDAELADSDAGRKINLFEMMSSTNNALVNLQRELYQKNAELERLSQEVLAQARTDQLTELLNRHGFFEIGDRQVAIAKRFNKPLVAIMLDIDHFKSFNDTYGHATGDFVLRAVAQRCSGAVREVDVIGRYGGEEFSVLLPESGSEVGQATAERLRAIVAESPLETEHGPLQVTISLGVATLNNETAELSDLLKLADQALYKAKGMGRNCVCVWDSTLS